MTDRFSSSEKRPIMSPVTDNKKDWTRHLWGHSSESTQTTKPESLDKKRLSVFEKIVPSTESIIDIRGISSVEDIQSTLEKVQKLSRDLSNCLFRLADEPLESESHWLEVQLRRYNDRLIEVYKDYREWRKSHYEKLEEDKDLLEANNKLHNNISSIGSYSLRKYNPYSKTDPGVLHEILVSTKTDLNYSRKYANGITNIVHDIKKNNNKGSSYISKKHRIFSDNLQAVESSISTISINTITDEFHLLFRAMMQHNKFLMLNNKERIENNLRYLQEALYSLG